MRLRNRLLIVGLGVIFFLIITPILVLFARGFMIDTKSWQIVKTGALVVASEPEKAQIVIEDKIQKKTTPATIRFLLPGDYNINIQKQGYQSWTKRLSIRSQLVTWANNNREFVTLFLAEPRLEEISETPSDKITPVNEGSIRGDNYTFILKGSILFKQNEALEKIYEPVKEAYWDEPAKKVVLSNDNEILILDPLNDNPDLILRSISPTANARLNWHTGYVFFQNEGKIKAIELDGRDHRNVYTIADALDNFAVSENGKLLYLFDQKETIVYRIR